MALTLNHFPVDSIEGGEETRLDGRRLLVDTDKLCDLILREDPSLQSVRIDLVRPGDSYRIINILDILEPRIKAGGDAETFPGILGPPRLCGSSGTNVLKGMSVITCGPMNGAEDALLDMKGPCADLSIFSNLENVVITLQPAEALSRGDFAQAVVRAGVRAAVFLGGATRENSPEDSETLEVSRLSSFNGHREPLPRIAYIYPIYSQGDARDMLLYGKNTRELVPTMIHPNEVFDGAVVWSGFCRPTKNTTYDHLNHGVLRTLYAAHGHSIEFVGTIVANHPKQYAEKILHAGMMARIADDVLGAHGVIITKDSGGQADTDLIQICEHCEDRGIKTALLTMEFAGNEGSSAGALVDTSRRADAIVSAGNCAEPIELPAMDRVIGGSSLKDYDQDPTAAVRVPYNKIPGTIGMLGANSLTAVEV